jgi:hypothetical protein
MRRGQILFGDRTHDVREVYKETWVKTHQR